MEWRRPSREGSCLFVGRGMKQFTNAVGGPATSAANIPEGCVKIAQQFIAGNVRARCFESRREG